MSHTPDPWTYHFKSGSYDIEAPSPTEPGKTRLVAQLVSFEDAKTVAAAPRLLAAIKRLASAAQNRENTMGDPCALLAAQAELRDATKVAIAAIAAAGIDSNQPNTNKG